MHFLEAVQRVGIVGDGEIEVADQVVEIDIHGGDEETPDLLVKGDVDVREQKIDLVGGEEGIQRFAKQAFAGDLVVVGDVGVDDFDDGGGSGGGNRVGRFDDVPRVVCIQAGKIAAQLD